MNEQSGATKWIGQSVERLEDPPLVTGRGRFAGDINFPRQLHMRIVRSNHAHANIVSIDTEAARALPGVVAVWTAADIADVPPIDFREGPIEKLAPYRQPVLAMDKVRYVGEPVAAVFAEDPYVAEDAADLVTMEVEELPPLLDARDDPARILVRPRHRSDDPDAGLRRRRGGVQVRGAYRRAEAHQRPALRRAAGDAAARIGRYDASRDVLELHGAAKVPHRNKELIARMLNRAPASVQCLESHVGGGFGIRGELYPEDMLVCVAAMRFERPVKWIEDRREHLIAANHSRNQHHHIKAACTDEGEILAIDDVIHHDNGAYVRTHATRVAMMTCGVLPGPYRVPGAYRAVCHFRLTNKTPAATYRAPGRFETTFVRERLVDAIAHQLKLDPIHVRRLNAVRVDEMPFKRPLEALGEEIHFDSGDYHALLDVTLDHVELDEAQPRARRAPRERRDGRRGPRHVRREGGPWPRRRRAHPGRYVGRDRGHHRRRVDRAGLRDGDGAGRRGMPRRRHEEDARHPRPDRPHRARHRRARLARHGDDGVGDARRRAEGPRQGARTSPPS